MSANRAASFVWYELLTPDTAAAATFYKSVVGWNADEQTAPGGYPYTIFSVGQSPLGGMMALTPEMRAQGVPPCWTGYVGVEDVDGSAAQVSAAGGKVLRAPADIPGVGRFAVVTDPYGATFIVFHGMPREGQAPATPGAPGTVGWHELHAGDCAGAFDFYAKVFGWTKVDDMDMGPMGIYRTFATGGTAAAGGMMTRSPETPGTFWLYYFNVDGIDAAMARAAAGGAKLMMGPHEVPGGLWVSIHTDPQGAAFALLSAKR